ncbi:MAG: HAMP domain-containing protein, partial [Rhodomicrobium sp.]|nr:HAMP domain-containing protein [Rhodomicrobium sp.]
TAPAEFHPKIIKSVNTWVLKFAIEPEPSANGKEPLSESLQEEIGNAFGEHASSVRVTLFSLLSEESQFELLFSDLWRDTKRTLLGKNSLIPKPPVRRSYAQISVLLQNGQWLNVVMSPRGLALPASPLLIQFATMAAISAIGIVLVLGRLTRPLKELARAASALGRGESSTKLEERGPREVVETIRAFNDMQERLSRFVHGRTKMLAALGHDLRTPITSLRLRAEFIEDEEIRDKILETLDEMAEMAEASLSFAREEAAQEETRLVDLGALISTVCADLSDAGLAVTCADTGSFAMRCRPVGLKRAFRNVIENAVTYGQRARISAGCKQDEAVIVIDDDGPGIPDGDIERVFKPFVRLERSRNKETGGVGLGLAIARSIVRSHGGDIVLQNRAGGGLRVTISLSGVTVLDAPHCHETGEAAA